MLIASQENMTWVAQFCYPECHTDDESDSDYRTTWSCRYHKELKPAGSFVLSGAFQHGPSSYENIQM